MKGTIVKFEQTGNLCIKGTLSTQFPVSLRLSDIKEFDLKEGDFVEYDGLQYDTVHIITKLESLK